MQINDDYSSADMKMRQLLAVEPRLEGHWMAVGGGAAVVAEAARGAAGPAHVQQ
jgi:hypothetical protein